MPPFTIQDIAAVCHAANAEYCRRTGDDSQPAWSEAPRWQQDSAVDGVRYHLDHPHAGPSGSHVNWMRLKLQDGWTYGPVKDAERKTHPCLVAFDQLPASQQAKDAIFVAIVHALKGRL